LSRHIGQYVGTCDVCNRSLGGLHCRASGGPWV
jgi:hypothetical protein